MENNKKDRSGYIFIPNQLLAQWKLRPLDAVCINGCHVLLAFPTKNEAVEISNRFLEAFNISPGSPLHLTMLRQVEDLKNISVQILRQPEKCDMTLITSLLLLKIRNRSIILGSIETVTIFESQLTVRYVSATTSSGVVHSTAQPFKASSSLDDVILQLERFSLNQRNLDQLETHVTFPTVDFISLVDEGDVKLTKAYRITSLTLLSVEPNLEDIVDSVNSNLHGKSKEKLFGLEEPCALLMRIVGALTKGKARQTAILLHGPPGCGKRSIIRSFAANKSVQFLRFEKSVFTSNYSSQPELAVKKYFDDVKKGLPCILYAPNIEDQFSSSEDGESDRRLRRALCEHLSLVQATRKVSLLATATDFADLHKDIRALFQSEILVPLPNGHARSQILTDAIATANSDSYQQVSPIASSAESSSVSVAERDDLANSLFGYSAADIYRLVDRALEAGATEQSGQERTSVITIAALQTAASSFHPSGLKGLAAPVASTRWSDIGGYAEVKTLLQRCVEMPLKHPEDYRRMGLKPPAGVLLYGPPGCSKTMFARALATECRLHMLSVSGASIYSRYVGDSERAMRRVLIQARASAPVVLFIDEIDAILPNRADSDDSNSVGERVLTELLTAMDGVEGKLDRVIVLAATNRPSKIDPALLRPGRLDKKILVPLPDQTAREAILRLSLAHHNQNDTSDLSPGCVTSLAERLAGCSGAEVVQVVEEAAHLALESWVAGGGSGAGGEKLHLAGHHLNSVLVRKGWGTEGQHHHRHSMEDYLAFGAS